MTIKKTILILGSIAIVVAILTFAFWHIPKLQIEQSDTTATTAYERLKLEVDHRRNLVGFLAGIAVLLGFYYTSRRIVAAEKLAESSLEQSKASNKQAEIALRQARATEHAQLTERFAEAVKMLSDENNMYIRLGGIHALARIAHDSEDDHWRVMEVLCAFLRDETVKRYGKYESENVDEYQLLDTDIQEICNVLKKRNRAYEEDGQYLNLEGVYLRRSDLKCVHLEGANLRGSHLERANLCNAQLMEARFDNASFKDAYLAEVDLFKACLDGAHFEEASLTNSCLRGVSAADASFEKAFLDEADLRGAFLSNSSFEGACFSGANLENAELSTSYLKGADNLMEVSIKGANILGVNSPPEGFVEWALTNGAVEDDSFSLPT